jgi:hypothetical protein
MKLVTVFKAFSPAEAELTRARLEAAGFHAVVVGELAALSMEGYSSATGGIRVQVLESEAEEVRQFLKSGSAPAE